MNPRLCIIGLGHIGLPTASLLSSKGFSVRGVDINPVVVESLRTAPFSVSSEVVPSDIYLIAVPTPLSADQQPDLSAVESALEAIRPHLTPTNLILIESTCPIGTTDRLAQSFPAHVAYCPERVLPGNIDHELVHNDRVVGGVTPQATERAAAFYRSWVKGTVLETTACTAEAVKLAENAYRDVNIAFANELSVISEHLDLDIEEIISLANRHPRVDILKPGVGVGGHCIPVDPHFIISAAPHLSQLMQSARRVNLAKTQRVLDQIRRTVSQSGATSVACLGLTYKADVADLRESPALAIADGLESFVEVLRVDPYVKGTHPLREALEKADLIVGLVPHRLFRNIEEEQMENKICLDFSKVFK